MKTNTIQNKTSNSILWSFEDLFSTNEKKGVVSSWSAASYWTFSPRIDSKIYITYPRGYNPNLKSKNIIKKQRVTNIYEKDIINVEFNGKKMNVYSPERTVVEIIKQANGVYNDVLVETVRNFFKMIKYSYEKLMEWAREFKVEDVVKVFVAVMNG